MKRLKRYSASPILEVQQTNSISIDTTSNTIKPLQIVDYLALRRKSYAFQLLKQFILFPQDSQQESFSQTQNNYVKQINKQKIEHFFSIILAIIKRKRQKYILSSFDKLKSYYKKKMIYRNKQYITNIVQKIKNVIKNQHQIVLKYVFTELIHNLRICQANQILQAANQHHPIPNFIQFEDKNYKPRQNHPFHMEHSHIQKNENQDFFESDSRIQIAKDFGLRKCFKSNYLLPNMSQNIINEIKTVKKTTRKSRIKQKKQQIFIIREDSIKSTHKNRKIQQYITIPLITENVKILEIKFQQQNASKKLSNLKNHKIMQNSIFQNNQCIKCQYCKKIKRNKEIMAKIYQNSSKY